MGRREERPSPRHVLDDPRAPTSLPNRLPRVPANADVFQLGAAPSQAPPRPPRSLTV